MRLLHRSMLHLSLALLPVLALWSAAFWFVVRDAVRDDLDEGLEDHQELILHRLEQDSTLLQVRDLGLYGFAVEPATGKVKKHFTDTILYVPAEGEMERVRLMTKGFTHEDRHYRMQVYTSTVEEDDLLEHLLGALVVLYILVVLTLSVVHGLVLRRLWRPFRTILAQLKSFRLGRGQELKDVPTPITEFQELKAAAQALVRHANEAFERQRAFTGNAAHELQTPLAIAINKLELVAEEADENERMAAVGEVIATLERLVRLNRSLLLLARIENHQFTDVEPVPVADLAREVTEEFADLAAHRRVELLLHVDGDLLWTMDPGLARTLVTNLVKNAIVHNRPDGRVEVEVDARYFRVTNTGADEALDPERIFQRFHKETTADGGTGLGLAIAKAITDLYGMHLRYRFLDGHVLEVVPAGGS
ncbi:MAG TPA: HAMP domain-containing sensor histidine kinase [Flavobacteriales bacterium]|nr:HAMP domain-containing sensor histidine kinase [Flavobacteriales bacterium]